MTVKELIAKLKKMNPDAIVVAGSFDHSYVKVSPPVMAQAETDGAGYYGEYWDEENLTEGHSVVDVIVLE